jgi:hypothetical protein
MSENVNERKGDEDKWDRVVDLKRQKKLRKGLQRSRSTAS